MNFWFCQDINAFAFPVNLIAGAFLLWSIWIMHRYYQQTRIVRCLTRMPATLTITALLIVLLIVEGIWAIQLFKSWIFILLEFLLLIILGLVILKRTCKLSIRNLFFLLNHAGLWIALSAALLGAPDREEYKIILPLHRAEYNAIDLNGFLHPLPFTARLDKFELEYYPQVVNSRIPKRFCSTITLQSKKEEIQIPVEVNHPVHFKGYSLYQDSYDISRGADSQYTILLVVSDPWIGLVYTGIFMLLAGAVGLIIYGPAKNHTYDLE